jgi:hypothetical protein
MSDETELKRREIIKLFACYPSVATMDATQARLTLAAYLDKLTGVTVDEVSAACRVISSRNEAFPPSAGQVLHQALDIRARRAKADADSVPRVTYLRPIDTLSPEEREASKARVAAILRDVLKGGARVAE